MSCKLPAWMAARNIKFQNTMSNAEFIRESVIEVLNDYSLLVEIAKSMDVSDVEIKYEDWFQTYPLGIIFSGLIVKSMESKRDIQEAFIKATLFDRACGEEWKLDFFDIPAEERQELMQLDLYKDMFYQLDPGKLRLNLKDYEKFRDDFIYYTTENGMGTETQNNYLKAFEDATILELGGCYCGDWHYFIASLDSVYIVNYGIWD